jgi:hypothetical protein
MKKEGNKYLFQLYAKDAKPIEDVVGCNSLMEAFNKIDSEYGLDWDNFVEVKIKSLGRG